MMNNAVFKTMLGAISALAIIQAAPVIAQTPPTAPSGSAASQPAAHDEMSEIIVTARRSEERLQDVPISITVLNQEELSQHNIVSTADLGSYVPSLSINEQFGPEKASFVIRGFTQAYHTAPTVGVYFADVAAPRALGPTTSGNGASGDSCDRSTWPAKKRTNGRRRFEIGSRIVPRNIGYAASRASSTLDCEGGLATSR